METPKWGMSKKREQNVKSGNMHKGGVRHEWVGAKTMEVRCKTDINNLVVCRCQSTRRCEKVRRECSVSLLLRARRWWGGDGER
mmetsp:Transcript_40301/g.104462  ORF Transcript_40301/g.104462 Transcript_40301/m.104462 type:complete len:84 (+) Transcript_40301:166-417(+)